MAGHELQENREAGHVCRSKPTGDLTPAPTAAPTTAEPSTSPTLFPTTESCKDPMPKSDVVLVMVRVSRHACRQVGACVGVRLRMRIDQQ